jgi:hypothetical protein
MKEISPQAESFNGGVVALLSEGGDRTSRFGDDPAAGAP